MPRIRRCRDIRCLNIEPGYSASRLCWLTGTRLRQVYRAVQAGLPFATNAICILPDHHDLATAGIEADSVRKIAPTQARRRRDPVDRTMASLARRGGVRGQGGRGRRGGKLSAGAARGSPEVANAGDPHCVTARTATAAFGIPRGCRSTDIALPWDGATPQCARFGWGATCATLTGLRPGFGRRSPSPSSLGLPRGPCGHRARVRRHTSDAGLTANDVPVETKIITPAN
jgi:hypothetical protein